MNKLKEKTNSLTESRVFEYFTVKDLPSDWNDNCKDNPYIKNCFLEFIERADCSEKKYCVFRNSSGKIDTQFMIIKTENNNIAMFTPFKFTVKMNSIYFPFSISSSAGIFGKETKKNVDNFLKTLEGFTMLVNLDDKNYNFKNFSQALIPPKCIFYIKWNSFDDYMYALRANYRRRYNNALKKSKELKLRFLKDNKTEFTKEMYNLYLDIYNNAEYKLGRIPIEYFWQKRCKIFVLENKDDVQ